MAVRIAKPSVNIREKLAELERPIGLNGSALMRTETPQEAFSLIGAGRRNLIINGDMQIDQRNGGVANASTTYGIDRWGQEWSSTGVTLSFQQVSEAPTGYLKSLKVTVSTGSASFTNNAAIRQVIEGFNSANLSWGTSSAKTITISFWVRSSLAGTFGGSITNINFNRTYPFFYTISVSNTWEYKTVTIPGDTTGTWATDNTAGLQLIFGLGAVSARKATGNVWANTIARQPTGTVDLIATTGATWQITGVQVEEGKVATPFEYRSYGQELALCQRYCYVIRGDFPSTQSGEVGIGEGVWNGTDGAYVVVKHPVPMRTNPALDFGNAGWYRVVAEAVAWRGVSSISLLTDSSSINQTIIYPRAVTDSRGLVARMTTQSTSAKFILSSEL